MIKKLNELNLSIEQKQIFKKANNWAFNCEMAGGCDWEIKQNIVNFINDNANLTFKIVDYFPRLL